MLARPPTQLHLQTSRRARLSAGLSAALLAVLLVPANAAAQDVAEPVSSDTSAEQPDEASTQSGILPGGQIDFEADQISYDSENDIISASGRVILRQDGQTVRADEVVWDRKIGTIKALGDVAFDDPDGNRIYTTEVELTDKFDSGQMQDLLIALSEGARIAARSGARMADGSIVLNDAAYSACAVIDPRGCDQTPSWRITAERVTYDPVKKDVSFDGAVLEFFGARLLPLPGLSTTTDGRARSGVLVPGLRISDSNGVEINGSYYFRLAENRDLTATGFLFTEAPPMISAQYRQLDENGAFQATGFLTRSRRVPIGDFLNPPGENAWRGYIFANGRYQLDPNWSATFYGRVTSDRTFLRRYDISRDDRLRSTINVERIDDDSYLSIAGWATQTLRFNAPQGQVPLALPVIDYRQRLKDPALGGTIELQANSLAIVRSEGQDTRRAFARAQWDLRRLTNMGQQITFTALARGDIYHSEDNLLEPNPLYSGTTGWQGRAIALGAVDVAWPLVGEAFGGTQVLTPRFQIVASPQIRNLAIPNEDARAVDLEDSNLFSLNRFPGYDRVESGVRFTYGFDWLFNRPNWRVKTTVGQSVRLTDERNILPDGTGLSDKVSDFVGRSEVRFKDFLKVTHRFRLDKDNFAVRRNELDFTVGSRRTYLEAGYLLLNRDITGNGEDLRDREELRVAGRVAFEKHWSVFGSAVINLTDRDEDPTFTSDGFEPLRTRLGIAYDDGYTQIGLTWRRDFTTTGDAERGNTILLNVSLRTLGF